MSSQQEKAAIATGRAQLRSLAAAPATKFPTTQRNRSWLRAGFKLIRQTEKYGCSGFIETILLPVFLTKKKKRIPFKYCQWEYHKESLLSQWEEREGKINK